MEAHPRSDLQFAGSVISCFPCHFISCLGFSPIMAKLPIFMSWHLSVMDCQVTWPVHAKEKMKLSAQITFGCRALDLTFVIFSFLPGLSIFTETSVWLLSLTSVCQTPEQNSSWLSSHLQMHRWNVITMYSTIKCNNLLVRHVKWSLYFKATHRTLKMWSCISGGLKIKVNT